jgi:hypothetical protein
MTAEPSPPEWLDGETASRAAAVERDEVDAEAAERRRAESALVTLDQRLLASTGRVLTVCLLGGHRVSGLLQDAGRSWLRLGQGRQESLVHTSACLTVDGLGVGSPADPPGGVHDPSALPPGPGLALRALMRARHPVAVLTVDSRRLEGTLVQVGADAVDLVTHPVDRPPRLDDPVTTVPWAGVAAICAC